MIDASAQRILRATTGTISCNPTDSDGEPVDPGTVTVGVVASDGTVVTAAGTATTGSTEPAWAYSVAQSALCDRWTATWKVGSDTIAVTEHEIVGGVYFTTAELRAAEPSVSEATPYTAPELVGWRREAEVSFESWTNCAWVPRFQIVDTYGTGGCSLGLGVFYPRRIAWVRTYSSDGTYTVLSDTEVAALTFTDSGALVRSGGWYGRYMVGVEHGKTRPPADLKRVAMRHTRRLAQRKNSGLSDRAQSYTTPEGQVVNLGRVGTAWRPTGDEVIDEVLRRSDIDHRSPGIA